MVQDNEWVDELLKVLENNCRYASQYIQEHFEGVEVTMSEGTHMLFLDLTNYCKENNKTLDDVIKAGWDVGVEWQDDRLFEGPYHICMNVALPLSCVQEAMKRLHKYVFNDE